MTTDIGGIEVVRTGSRLLTAEDVAGVTAYIEQLQAENTKLRELVRDMYLCSDETCTDCEHHDYSGEGFWCKRGVGWKRARMRELGIGKEN